MRGQCFYVASEILCSERNSGSQLCRQVESLRDQLPRLEKKLKEQQSFLKKTSESLLLLTRAFGVLHQTEKKVGKKVVPASKRGSLSFSDLLYFSNTL